MHRQRFTPPQTQTPLQQFGGAFTGLGHVDMRVGAVSHQSICCGQHTLCDVGM